MTKQIPRASEADGEPLFLREEVALRGTELAPLLEGQLRQGVSCRFRVTGSSMYPFVRPGDVVTVSPAGADGVRLGDIVACAKPGGGGMVLHRVVGRRAELLHIKGDNVRVPDGWVPAANAMGLAAGIERRGRPVRLGLGRSGLFVALYSRGGPLRPLLWPIALASRVYWFQPRRAGGS